MSSSCRNLCLVDTSTSARSQSTPLHNRWHPSIPAIGSVHPGETFQLSCLDCTGNQIANSDNSDDLAQMQTSLIHVLSGPIHVHGARPGDLLAVDIIAIEHDEWGYTGIVPNGFLGRSNHGVLKKAIWDLNAVATSRHVPHVTIPKCAHPGVLATAPSEELLSKWNQREASLTEQSSGLVKLLEKDSFKVSLPNVENVMLGQLDRMDTIDKDQYKKIAIEAARTVPGREHGGNCDIKDMGVGSRVFLPVYVPGGNLSVGDLHYSQGDGEVTLCGAIEMAGTVKLCVNVISNGVPKYLSPHSTDDLSNVFPVFTRGRDLPEHKGYIMFGGVSVDKNGRQWWMDATVSMYAAVERAVSYLQCVKGYSRDQAYVIVGVAACHSRINSIVAVPNCVATISIPKSIFSGTTGLEVEQTKECLLAKPAHLGKK